MPIDEQCRFLTAFITPFGLYEWCRLPMGPKGGGSYFMQMIQRVLNGLLWTICEVYLDDVLVYGATEEEFLSNLERVFTRFGEYGLTIHPDKCFLGISRVEYVGHLLDAEGLHFTTEKRETVLNFVKPVIHQQMKSFLGSCNYFRDHIQRYSEISRPLHTMTSPYVPTRKLEWTTAREAAWEALKTAVHDCQKLYFVDPSKGGIHVETDASDYGMGGFVYQEIDGTRFPIIFLSKSFDTTQQRWSVPEKECYAIWFTLRRLEHLLRDVPFTLHTDHKNLTYFATTGSTKVLRWKLEVQEYDCQVQYITGAANSMADALSRFCPRIDEATATDTIAAMVESIDSFEYNFVRPSLHGTTTSLSAITTPKWDTSA
jgi:hypothetical protein